MERAAPGLMTRYPNITQQAPLAGITGGRPFGIGTTPGAIVPSPLRAQATAPRINPDGSAAPMAAPAGGYSETNAPPVTTNPITGAAAGLGLTNVDIANMLMSPASLVERQFTEAGQDPYAGLADAIISMIPPDQLDLLLDVVNASVGLPGTTDLARINQMAGLNQSLMGGQATLPSMGQLLGPLFNAQTPGQPGNPFYGLLAGGDPANQARMMLSAVPQLASMTGISSGQGRALEASLNALARSYLANSGNTSFIDYIQQRAPQLAGYFGG